jgi:hypothetical protein
MHLLKREFICDRCGRDFLNKSTLLNHIKKDHLNVKNYSCGNNDFYCNTTNSLFFTAKFQTRLKKLNILNTNAYSNKYFINTFLLF